MADKPQSASPQPDHNRKSISNILTGVIIVICIVVAILAIYVGEKQNIDELRKELADLKSQIGMYTILPWNQNA